MSCRDDRVQVIGKASRIETLYDCLAAFLLAIACIMRGRKRAKVTYGFGSFDQITFADG
jgi:hypothetical protein